MSEEEIKTMTEEERIRQLEWSDQHEFSYSYAYYLLEENKQLKSVLKEIREWLKYKTEQLDEFDITKRKETGAFWFGTRGEMDNLLEIINKGWKNDE